MNKRLKVKFRKISKRWKKLIEPHLPELNGTQQLAIKIIRQVVVNPKAKILIAPISDVRYVEFRHYFIRFGSNFASIRNGKFAYYVEFDLAHGIQLVAFADRIIEKRRHALDDQYDANTVSSLSKILEQIASTPNVKSKKRKK